MNGTRRLNRHYQSAGKRIRTNSPWWAFQKLALSQVPWLPEYATYARLDIYGNIPNLWLSGFFSTWGTPDIKKLYARWTGKAKWTYKIHSDRGFLNQYGDFSCRIPPLSYPFCWIFYKENEGDTVSKNVWLEADENSIIYSQRTGENKEECILELTGRKDEQELTIRVNLSIEWDEQARNVVLEFTPREGGTIDFSKYGFAFSGIMIDFTNQNTELSKEDYTEISVQQEYSGGTIRGEEIALWE